MKRVIFKVFAVFITVVAVAMMGASLATFFVHPDVRAEMNTEAMQNYTFEEIPGETPQWTVTRRFSIDPAKPADRIAVGTYKSPYEALTKAHGDLKNYLSQQTSTMSTDKTTADDQLKLIEASQLQDIAAIETRAKQLQEVSEHWEGVLLTQSESLQTSSENSKKIREETDARRTDVERLSHELKEARTDLFRLTAIRRDLMDRLVRLQIENHELADRKSQVQGTSQVPESIQEYDGESDPDQ